MKHSKYALLALVLLAVQLPSSTATAASCNATPTGQKISVPGFESYPTRLEGFIPNAPLIVMMHGMNNCIPAFQEQTAISPYSTFLNILWVSGQPASPGSSERVWVAYRENSAETYAYLRAAVAEVDKLVQSRTVTAVGMSMGGSMALASVCKIPDVFDAAISVAGRDNIPCTKVNRSLMVVGGSADSGSGPNVAPTVAARWVTESTTCGPSIIIREQPELLTKKWDCSDSNVVVMTQLYGVGHVWPLLNSYNVNDQILSFVSLLYLCERPAT